MSSARILIVGDEVLSGDVQDRNIHFLARRLTAGGNRVRGVVIVPDEEDVIVSAIRSGIADGGRLLVTGGIGPTHDDRTRPAVARALDLPLEAHAEAEERLRLGYGTGLTPSELLMARLPRGSRLLVGPLTGVFGFQVGPVYVFPGVPDLLADIFERVATEFAGTPDARRELITRRKEGEFAEPLADVQRDFPDVAIGSYPVRDEHGWHVRLTLKGADAARVDAAATRVRDVTEAT